MTANLQTDIWTKLQAFPLDDPDDPLPFSTRLARENGWTRKHTRRVLEEYRRFLYLAGAAGHPVSPSEAVDQAWHLHLCYTESYWDRLCGEVLCQPLHHQPTRGGTTERAKFDDWYRRTLQSYREHFGQEPPADLWPSEQPTASEHRWVDLGSHVPIPRWAIRWSGLAAVGSVLLMGGGCASGGESDVGLVILFIAVPLLVIWAIIASNSAANRRGSNTGGCGAHGGGGCGVGGWDGSGGCDGGSSGCGGGCGGG